MPSLRAKILTVLVRLMVKRWPRNDPAATVRRARKVFGQPEFLRSLGMRGVSIESVSDGVRGEWVRPLKQLSDGVVLYLHGGGYVSCSPQTHRPITAALARLTGASIFALDYRLAPEHPFPGALDDAVSAYQWLVKNGVSPDRIAIAGDSAGGGLAVAILVALRDTGSPLPACAVCLSPWVDLTGTCDFTNKTSCAMFAPADGIPFAQSYLNGMNADSPLASPIYADLRGLPPLLIQVSGSELLFDDAMRLNEKAASSGVECALRIYEGVPHVWQMFARIMPEARAALAEIAVFLENNWGKSTKEARRH